MTEFNNKFHIIYGAGYSIDGRTYYVDSRIARYTVQKSGRTLDVYKYLMVHESTEKHLEDKYGYKYQYAHEKATGMERHAVERDNFNWDEYQTHILAEIGQLDELPITEPVPPDLDLKPESDYHDISKLHAYKKVFDKMYPDMWESTYVTSGDLKGEE